MLNAKEPRRGRSLIFLLVLLCHVGVLGVLMRVENRTTSSREEAFRPLVLLALPQPRSLSAESPAPRDAQRAPRFAVGRMRPPYSPPSHATPSGVETPPASVPPLDWEHEIAVAVQNDMATAARERGYRDLSASLSPSQAAWIQRNHLEPATPGLAWSRPRVEIMPDGMPILHINVMLRCNIAQCEIVAGVALGRRFLLNEIPHNARVGTVC